MARDGAFSRAPAMGVMIGRQRQDVTEESPCPGRYSQTKAVAHETDSAAFMVMGRVYGGPGKGLRRSRSKRMEDRVAKSTAVNWKSGPAINAP